MKILVTGGTGIEASVKQIFDTLAEALDYKGSPAYAKESLAGTPS